jgi:hypothetical protein
MPDGQSLVVPIGGQLLRVDFATGQSRVIPMTVAVKAEIAPRVYSQVRVEDGPARTLAWRQATGVQRHESPTHQTDRRWRSSRARRPINCTRS